MNTTINYGDAAYLELKIRELIDGMNDEEITAMMMRGGRIYVTGKGAETDVDFNPGNPDDRGTHESIDHLISVSIEAVDCSDLEFDEEAEEYIPMGINEYRALLEQMHVAERLAEDLENSFADLEALQSVDQE